MKNFKFEEITEKQNQGIHLSAEEEKFLYGFYKKVDCGDKWIEETAEEEKSLDELYGLHTTNLEHLN